MTCGVYACPSNTFTINNCDPTGLLPGATCVGSQYLRLYDASGNALTSNANGCGNCASLTYFVPASSPCQVFSIHQGCAAGTSCSGVMMVTGQPLQTTPAYIPPTLTPSAGPTAFPTRSPTFTPTAVPTASLLPLSFWTGISHALSQNYFLGRITLPVNYVLSFQITPIAVVTSNYASIIHLTATNSSLSGPGARLPSIWFYPGTFVLDVDFESVNLIDYFTASNSPAITGSVSSTITVSIVGTQMTVGVVSASGSSFIMNPVTLPAGRGTWANVLLFAGDPWFPAANAMITNVAISAGPTSSPTVTPTWVPTTAMPSSPSAIPSLTPSILFGAPTPAPVFSPTPYPTALPTSPTFEPTPVFASCQPYSVANTNNAMQNFAICGVFACPGAPFTVGDCSAGGVAGPGCFGDQYLRLLRANGSTVAVNDNSCGLCASVTYQVPTGQACQQFYAYQGCTGSSACSGTMMITGAVRGDVPTQIPTPVPSAIPTTFTPTSKPTFNPTPAPSPVTTNCPAFSASNTNSAIFNYVTCGFYACPDTMMSIGNCNQNRTKGGSTCNGNQFLRLFTANGTQLAINDDGCGLCSYLSFSTFLPCQTYSIHQVKLCYFNFHPLLCLLVFIFSLSII